MRSAQECRKDDELPEMKDLLPKLVALGVLALISGVSLATLVRGLLTGAIDGPARGGNDLLHLASRPSLFWAMALAYFAISTGAAIAGYRFLKKI